MSEAVFDSYIKSVYGSGSSMEYFDRINGGSYDIFGGLDSVEIFDEPQSVIKSNDIEQPNNSDDETIKDDKSIIGYIQIGIHTMPIVDNNQDDLIAPMEIQLNPTLNKLKKITPDDVSDFISTLT